MKNQINKTSIVAGSILAIALFALAFGAFPQAAQAQGFNCHLQVWSNGYNQCNYQEVNFTPPAVNYPTQPPINYSPQPVYQYQQPQYYPQPQYASLSASCYANNSSVAAGTSVQWYANVSGGNGSYSYTWSGTDGLNGYGQSVSMNYYNPGYKTAYLTVYSSNGQTAYAACSNSVNVYAYQQPIYVQPAPVINTVTYLNTNASGLDIGCYAEPAYASVNQPVVWNAEVTGGHPPYKVTWSGTDGLVGESSTAVKYYQTPGPKSAIVTVTSADGRTGTRACSNAVAVRGATVARKAAPPVTPVVQAPAPKPAEAQVNQNLSAASVFSLSNVPWGWVAILIILILFATVMYLLFNKPKI